MIFGDKIENNLLSWSETAIQISLVCVAVFILYVAFYGSFKFQVATLMYLAIP